MSLKQPVGCLRQKIQERIVYAKERQQFWKDKKDIAKIWAGIESELTLVSRDLDEVTKQIRIAQTNEIDEVKVVLDEIERGCYKNQTDVLNRLYDIINEYQSKFLAVLVGGEKK